MNKQHRDAQERLDAALKQAGIKSANGTTETVVVTESRKDKRRMFKTKKTVSADFLDWALKAEVSASKSGLNTKDKVLQFEEVNASETVPVDGFIIHPVKNGDNVTAIQWHPGKVSVPKHSPLYDIITKHGIPVCRLSGDTSTKAAAYKMAAAKLFLDRKKYLIGNLKAEDSVLVVVTREQAAEFLGSDLGIYDNPFKPWLAAFGTPSRLIYKGDENEVIRIRIIDDMKTKYGHKLHDGTMFTRFDVLYRTYAKRKENQTEEEYEATRKTFTVKSSHQDRIFGKHNGVMFPACKIKGYNDRLAYFKLCKQMEFNPYETDAIMCIGNVKTKNHNLKHGDIFEVPATLMRIIGVKTKSGKSSIGSQAMCLDLDTVTKLFIEKGMAERAKIFRDAACGSAVALEKVLNGQEESSAFEDITMMWIMNMLFAIQNEDNGEWEWPRFESNYNNVCVRLNRYMTDNVMKCKLSNFAFYLEVNPELDDLEQEHFRKTREHINLVILPNNRKVRKAMIGRPSKGEQPEFELLNVGRNPVVGKGNMQGADMLRDENGHVVLNDSHDTIEISAALAAEIFGDQDGDKLIIAPSNVAKFPVYRSQAPAEAKKVKADAVEVSDKDLAIGIINAAMFIMEAAIDTGALDLTRRQIYIEAWLKGQPITAQEGFEIGLVCENAIQRIKHVKDKGAAGIQAGELSVKDQLIMQYARGKRIMDAKMAPREFIITKRHADKRFGTEREIIMRKIQIINETKFHQDFPFNVMADEIRGTNMTLRHGHSEKIRMMFEECWRKYRGHVKKDEYGFDVAMVIQEAKYIDGMYRNTAKDALKLEDEARAEMFRGLRENIHAHLANLKRYLGERFLNYLTLYMGTISFGTVIRGRGETGSRSGLALRFWPEELLIYIARLVNPNNPWCMAGGNKRAELMIRNLLKKKGIIKDDEATEE